MKVIGCRSRSAGSSLSAKTYIFIYTIYIKVKSQCPYAFLVLHGQTPSDAFTTEVLHHLSPGSDRLIDFLGHLEPNQWCAKPPGTALFMSCRKFSLCQTIVI